MSIFNLSATVPTAPELDQTTQILVDADYWTYQLAAVLQSKNPKPGDTKPVVDEQDGEITHVESIGNLYQLIDATLRDLQFTFNSSNLIIYLQGTENFRDKLAVTKPYKGGRSNKKPYYYQATREYLKEKYGATVVNGHETDDQVCIDQLSCMEQGIPSVIVSPDKDLLNMFGYNYNPRTKVLRWVTNEEAQWSFWIQMVVGDNAVDNIPGVFKVGAAWVKKHAHLDLDDFKNAVYDLYMTKHDAAYMLEQGNLLHMCRTYEEIGKWRCDYPYHKGYNEPEPIEYNPVEAT